MKVDREKLDYAKEVLFIEKARLVNILRKNRDAKETEKNFEDLNYTIAVLNSITEEVK